MENTCFSNLKRKRSKYEEIELRGKDTALKLMLLSKLEKGRTHTKIILDFWLNLYIPGENEARGNI